ncbi:hypothetical protein Lal_00022138 [Lupinus albus]|nr:hypothetical protein Lal_00022138 [Lupinus albus]
MEYQTRLNREIARELAIQPFSVTHAIGLAKLVENKIAAFEPTTWLSARPNIVVPIAPTIGSTSTIVNTTSSTTLIIKRLTAIPMQERRAQGLCYDCDEKYIGGHHYKSKQFLLTDDPMDTTFSFDTNIYQSWDPRLSERFSPRRERLTREGEILGGSHGRIKSWAILEDSRLGEKWHFGSVETVRFSLERESLA